MNTASALRPLVCYLATGGTIAMKIDPERHAAVPALSPEDLLASAPQVAAHAAIEVQNLWNVPSAYMDPVRWRALSHAVSAALERTEVTGVVISHGTDTIEETAWWLDLTVDSDKPVVLTAAQRNASEADSDGPRNLLAAVRVAVDGQSRGKGALVVMNGRIHAAREVTKTHTASVEGFSSGECGVLGVVDPDRIVYWRAPLRRAHVALRQGSMPRVEIVTMYGGADGQLIRAALDHGARGLIVQGLGSGNVNEPMYRAILEALARSVPVVIATRVPNGRLLPQYGWEGGGQSLLAAGALLGNDLSAQKARILLMLLLQAGVTGSAQLQAELDR